MSCSLSTQVFFFFYVQVYKNIENTYLLILYDFIIIISRVGT